MKTHTHTYELSATFLRPAFQERVLNRFSHSARPGFAKIMGHSEAQSNAEQRREDQSNSEWQDTWNSTVCPVIMTFCFFIGESFQPHCPDAGPHVRGGWHR